MLLAIALTASLCHKYSTEDINTHIANVCLISLPLSVSGLGIIFAASFLCNSSCRKELDAILGKNESTSNEITNSSDIVDKIGAIPEKAESFYDKNEKIINNIIRVTILIISVVFIIIGIINGGMADVLGKAVRICTECIGLG